MMNIIKINGKMDSDGNDIFTPRCSLAHKLFKSFGKSKVNIEQLRLLQSNNKVNCSIYWI